MDYIPILIMMAVGALVAIGGIGVSFLIGPKLPNAMKDRPFECGVPAVGSTKQRVSVRFYLVAILFLLFDVETVFFYPWAVVYKKFLTINQFIMWEMIFFVALLMVGYLYILWKGALKWE